MEMSDDEDWDKDLGLDDGADLKKLQPLKLSGGNSRTEDQIKRSPLAPLKLSLEKLRLANDEASSDTSSPPTLKKLLDAPAPKSDDEFDDDDWSNDFEGGIENNSSSSESTAQPAKLKITGIQANPNADKEDWDKDFEFDSDKEKVVKIDLSNKRNSLTVSRALSTTIASGSIHLESYLREILQSFPDFNDKQKHKHHHHHHKKKKGENQDSNNNAKHLHSTGKSQERPQMMKSPSRTSLSLKSEKVDESRTIWELGVLAAAQNNHTDAMKHFQRAQSLLQGLRPDERDIFYESELLFHMGTAARNLHDEIEAIDFLKTAADCLYDKKQPAECQLKSRIYFQLGVCHVGMNNANQAAQCYGDSLKCVLNALPVSDIHWDMVAKACFQIAKCCSDLAMESELIKDYLKKATECAIKSGDTETQTAAATLQNTLHISGSEPETESKSATGNSATENDVDDDDWDAELGLDAQQRLTLHLNSVTPGSGLFSKAHPSGTMPTSSSLASGVSGADQELLPKKYKMTDALKSDVEIIKYPKATFFFSMKTKEGHRFMNESALESWLASLVNKHPQLFHTTLMAKSGLSPIGGGPGGGSGNNTMSKATALAAIDLEFKQKLLTKLHSVKKYSIEWAKVHLEQATALYILDRREMCWELFYDFFVDLKDVNISKIKDKEQEAFLHCVINLVYVSSKLWTKDDDKSFQHLIGSLKKFDPRCSDLATLIEIETYCHHKFDEMDQKQLLQHLSALCRLYNTVNARVNSPAMRIRASSSASQLPLATDPMQFSDISDNAVKARAISDLHFILNDISPMNTLHRDAAEADDDDDHEKERRRKSSSGSPGQSSADLFTFEGSELLEPEIRWNILQQLYPTLKPSFLKARVAYAMGLHTTMGIDGGLSVAEQLFFECLYIMDVCHYDIDTLPPIVSELGTNALMRYGEVLLANYKYQYAIVSFESAIKNFKARKRTGYFSLLKRLATITKDNDDYKRSIEYYKEVLDTYYKEGKTNEIRYVSEVMSSLYLEIGDFRKAELYVLNAINATGPTSTATGGLSTIPGLTVSTSINASQPGAPAPEQKMDAITFRLQMKLADLYLESYHYEKGIELLELLTRSLLPMGTRSDVLTKLAKAYVKKRWFKECLVILEVLESELQQSAPFGGHTILHPIKSAVDLASKQEKESNLASSAPGSLQHSTSTSHHSSFSSKEGGAHSSFNTDKRTLKYWELSGINHFHAHQYSQALFCVDTAISLCPPTSLSSLARYYMLRGKIFQALASSSNVQFPTTLKPSSTEMPAPSPTPSSTNLTSAQSQQPPSKLTPTTRVYTCAGDLVQECISSYDKAYNYFKAIGDDVHIAKCVNYIAQTYLERVFCPVALLHYPYSELARLPAFDVSDKVKSPPAKDTVRHKRSKSENPSQQLQQAKDFFISFEKIENPALCALNIAADTFNPLLMASSYLNMAELRYLQGDTDAAFAFWSECKELIFQLFMDSSTLLGKGSPPASLEKIFKLTRRLTRFMFCFDSEIINKNIHLIDAYLLLQIDHEQSTRRPVQIVQGSLFGETGPQGGSGGGGSNSSSSSSSSSASDKSGSTRDEDSFEYDAALLKVQSIPRKARAPSLLQNPGANTYPPPNTFLTGALGVRAPHSDTRKSAASVFNNSDGASAAAGTQPPSNNNNSSNANSPTSPNSRSFAQEIKLSRTLEINEECAERVWGFLYAIYNQINNYIKGKLTQEELLTRNRRTLRKIYQVKRGNDAFKQVADQASGGPAENSTPYLSQSGSGMSSKAIKRAASTRLMPTTPRKFPTFQELCQSNRNLTKLIFALQLSDYVIYYVPATGDKRIQQLGGKLENTRSTPNQQSSAWYLNLHFVASPDESVSLMVNPVLSLDKLLKYLCNNPYWEDAEQRERKRSFFGSLGKSSVQSLKKPKFLVRTKGFHDGTMDLLSSLAGTTRTDPSLEGKVWSSVELSRISFAKKTINQIDSSVAFVPLTVSSQTTVAQCFSMQEVKECNHENPLQLYLYLSSSHSDRELTSSSQTQKDIQNRSIVLTQEMLIYLAGLVVNHNNEENTEHVKKILGEVADTIVPTVIDILPYTDEKTPPLALICSKMLNVFPWELMLTGKEVIRFFSLQDMLDAWRKRMSMKDDGSVLPKYFSCYFSGFDKYLASMEDQRRDWVIREHFHHLNLRQKLPSCMRFSHTVCPFHSPMIKKGKRISAYKRQYKYVTWCDLGLVDRSEDLVRIADSVNVTNYPDMLEATEPLLYLMRCRPNCTFLFIPSFKMKQVVTKLMKLQEDFLKPKSKGHQTFKGCYQFLMTALAGLQQELSIPIAAFNYVS